MRKVILVACSNTKGTAMAPAEDLYTSQLFRKARAFAERESQWFILSASYGLLYPGQVIVPYDRVLTDMPKLERLGWADRVAASLKSHFKPGEVEFVFLAGRAYRKPLQYILARDGFAVSAPLDGLGIGQQLGWLKREVEGCPATA